MLAARGPRRPDILVVEDDPDQSDLLKLGFSRLGLAERVACAGDAAQAWDLLERGGVKVVLSDLCLGPESGLDLLLAVGRREGDVPARVLYSAAMPEDLAWMAREAGILVLVKGVGFHREIPETVRRLLDAAAIGGRTVAGGGL